MEHKESQTNSFINALKVISILAIALFSLGSCNDKTLNSMAPEISSQEDSLSLDKKSKAFANQLINRSFGEFFIYPMHDNTINTIWSDTNNHVLMDRIMTASDISMEAKFLVCEIYFKKDHRFLERYFIKDIAEIYASALVNNYTGMANSWGLLYEHEDAGTAGAVFLILGDLAIPTLTKLLEDDRILLSYNGSIESTIGNGYKFRIKDFAAYYIGEILNTPLKYFPENPERDSQINELKVRIQKLDE
ncbi:MAG: hypothetical protein ACJASQ_002678 [Crocinitomicaceae bacterium]|jgi:hypothetical protein